MVFTVIIGFIGSSYGFYMFLLVDHIFLNEMEMVWTGHFRSPSPRRSEDTSIKDKAKLALNAILQNIQAPGAVKVMLSLEVKDLQI
jgi:hypothetical protein